jgi:hypothetical protein
MRSGPGCQPCCAACQFVRFAGHTSGLSPRSRSELAPAKEASRGAGDVMRWGRAVAYIVYAALAVAFVSGGLACESTSQTSSNVGPPGPTGPERTPPLPKLALVTSIAPRAGSGGSRVTISGSGFNSAKDVCFGSRASPDYRVSDSGKRITAVAPAGSGTVPVAVITAAGVSAVRPGDTFTYRGSALAGGATSSASPLSLCASMPPEAFP